MFSIAVPVWQTPLRTMRIRFDSIRLVMHWSFQRVTPLPGAREKNVPAPKPRGDIRLAQTSIKKCPRLGWARRKTHPSLWGHSVGLLLRSLLQQHSCYVFVNVPGLGGPGGKPTQAPQDILPTQARVVIVLPRLFSQALVQFVLVVLLVCRCRPRLDSTQPRLYAACVDAIAIATRVPYGHVNSAAWVKVACFQALIARLAEYFAM